MGLLYLFEVRSWNPSPIEIKRVFRSELETISKLFDSLSEQGIIVIEDSFRYSDGITGKRLI